MTIKAHELIESIASGLGMQDNEDALDFLIDNIAEVTAKLLLVLQYLIDKSETDETTSML